MRSSCVLTMKTGMSRVEGLGERTGGAVEKGSGRQGGCTTGRTSTQYDISSDLASCWSSQVVNPPESSRNSHLGCRIPLLCPCHVVQRSSSCPAAICRAAARRPSPVASITAS